ncbi:MAG: TadE/TadG family type IV pilus assembly protein [Erythrobacter sp.]|jgi:hypothetical protein
MALLTALLRNRRGNATLELAFVTPVLLVMSLASVDVALGFVHRMTVQEQAQVGADYVFSKMEEIPLKSEIALEIHNATGVPLSDITVSSWIECDNVKKPLESLCANAGEVLTEFLKIDVSGTYTPILDIPYYADYVQPYTHTGSVTIQVR